MEDLTLHDVLIREEATPQLDGSTKRETKVVFYLGKHGPFTERFPKDQPFDAPLRARVEALTAQFRSLGF